MAVNATLNAPEAEPVTVTQAGGRKFWSVLTRSKWVTVGLAIFVLYVIMAIIGPMIAPYDPQGQDYTAVMQPPSPAHWLGTTQLGQDVLSQLLVGFGPTLELGFLAGVIATALSIIIGVSSGYYAGSAGEGLSLLSNVFLVIPQLPLLVVIYALDPKASLWVYAVALAALGWAWGARVLRAQTIALANQDFVLAAKASGEPAWRIILFEILPNELPVLATSFVFTVIGAIGSYVALSFVGLVNLSSQNWGVMLYYAFNAQAVSENAWWWYVPPGIAVAIILLGLVMLNFGIDEFINPRLKAAGISRKQMKAASLNPGVTPVVRRVRDTAPAGGPAGAETVRSARRTK
ncbi:MAG: ABC transporter permease [Streptosporangiales bacterium]|jgi:peptide/nickel transport system permease protein|nr:ABC transporter permease [Streptosporangiales bacterium]